MFSLLTHSVFQDLTKNPKGIFETTTKFYKKKVAFCMVVIVTVWGTQDDDHGHRAKILMRIRSGTWADQPDGGAERGRNIFARWPWSKVVPFDAEFYAEFNSITFTRNSAQIANRDDKYFAQKSEKKSVFWGKMIFFDRKPALKIPPFDTELNCASNLTRFRPNSGNIANPVKKMSNMVLTLPTLFSFVIQRISISSRISGIGHVCWFEGQMLVSVSKGI